MARPRSIEADVVQTFHCSYVLKVGIERASDVSHAGNSSAFVRHSVEETCRALLGPTQWERLQSASDKALRRDLLEQFVPQMDLTKIRRAIGTDGAGTRDGRATIDQTLQSYIDELETEKRRTEVDLALCVALDEAIDGIRKISLILRKSKISQGSIRFMQRAAAKFPDALRAELDAAIINRVAASVH